MISDAKLLYFNCSSIWNWLQTTVCPCTPADYDPVLLQKGDMEVVNKTIFFGNEKGLFDRYFQYQQSESGGRYREKKKNQHEDTLLIIVKVLL